MDTESLNAIDSDLRKCPGCGQCRFVCPVFAELGDESSVARGRISLARAARSGETPPTQELAKRMSECLLCMACVEECPSQVKVNEIVLAARADLAKELGVGTLEKLAVTGLGKAHGWISGLMPIAGMAEHLAAAQVPDHTALKLRFSLGPLRSGQLLPRIAGRPLIHRLPERIKPVGKKRGTVVYFVGCMDNYCDVQVGLSAIKVLAANGFEVIVPKGQACCALPMMVYGLEKDAEKLVQRNLDALLQFDADAIVTTCASCGGALRQLYPSFAERIRNMQLLEKANALSSKARDVSEFLAEAGLRTPMSPVAIKVTYHDPCHLSREQGVRRQPRELLNSVPGLELVEMKQPDRCCGGAGSFGFTHRELSESVNDKKIQSIEATDANAVVTGCPSCKLYIANGLVRHCSNKRVVHTVQILAESVNTH